MAVTRYYSSFFLAANLLLANSSIWGHEYGAPLTSCNTMTPSPAPNAHSAYPSIGTFAPFQIRVTDRNDIPVYEYQPGGKQVLKVAIRGIKFRGFLIQARLLSGGLPHRVGRFVQPVSIEAKPLHCDADRPYSTLTNRHSRLKQNLSFFWMPPDQNVGPVVFVATVVRSRTRYWTRLKSTVLFPASNTLEVDRRQCGNGFGCLKSGDTADCDSNSNCQVVIKWKCYERTLSAEYALRPRRSIPVKESILVGLGWNNDEATLCQFFGTKRRYRSRQRRRKKKRPRALRVPVEANVDNYYLIPHFDGIVRHKFGQPVLMKSASFGNLSVCRFERNVDRDLPSAELIYAEVRRDGSVRRLTRLPIMSESDSEPLNLCRHEDVSVALPSGSNPQTHSAQFSFLSCLFVTFLFTFVLTSGVPSAYINL